MHCDAFLSPNLTSFIHQQTDMDCKRKRRMALQSKYCIKLSQLLECSSLVGSNNTHTKTPRTTAMDRAYFSLACAIDDYFVHFSCDSTGFFFFSWWVLISFGIASQMNSKKERKSILVYLIIQRLPLSRSCKSFVMKKTARKSSIAFVHDAISIRARLCYNIDDT